jgi:MFS family permease
MPFASYIKLVKSQPKLLSFGFLMAFASCPGETYFIGVFGPAIQNDLNLDHTQWGSIYMVGTLASMALLPWTGGLIDRFSLTRYTIAVSVLLTIACAFISITLGALSLMIAIFLLRHAGQGLTYHISTTSMARYFNANRGRALSLASMGGTVGGSLLPLAAVTGISIIGWRSTYVGAGVLSGFVILPVAIWLLRGHHHRHRIYLSQFDGETNKFFSKHRSWSKTEVLGDPRFYLLLNGFIAANITLTAMFFHHINLADAKNWSHTWVTGNYVVYSIAAMVVALGVGPLIDKYQAVRLAPFILLPMFLALLVIAMTDAPMVVLPYMLLLGINTGLVYPIMSAIWPELYGVKHIGSIKSVATPIALFGSAVGPVIMGSLIDLGLSIETVCVFFALYCLTGVFSAYIVLIKSK